jgi:cytosine/adenosine deaminase-related metal-dependent hydrolase
MRPVEWLLNSAPVDRRWCFVHATHMTEAETARFAGSGAVAGLCPITECNLGDGVFPATGFLGAGGAFGIGTDSNVLINVAQELRQLEYSQRLRDRIRNALAGGANCSTGRTLYEAALRGGAQAVGLGIGVSADSSAAAPATSVGAAGASAMTVRAAGASAAPTATHRPAGVATAPATNVLAGIEVGAPADMLSLATDNVIFAGRNGDQLLDTFIFAGGDRCIDSVWRAGRRVVVNGRHTQRATIESRYSATLERLLRA